MEETRNFVFNDIKYSVTDIHKTELYENEKAKAQICILHLSKPLIIEVDGETRCITQIRTLRRVPNPDPGHTFLWLQRPRIETSPDHYHPYNFPQQKSPSSDYEESLQHR